MSEIGESRGTCGVKVNSLLLNLLNFNLIDYYYQITNRESVLVLKAFLPSYKLNNRVYENRHSTCTIYYFQMTYSFIPLSNNV